MSPKIVFLATAWGPKKGGIYSFYADLAAATARAVISRSLEVVCVVGGTTAERDLAGAASQGVTVVDASIPGRDSWLVDDSQHILDALGRAGLSGDALWWVGHDRVTGEVAIKLASSVGERSALIHHASYRDYGSSKHGLSAPSIKKQDHQHRMSSACDRLLAVGPLL